MEEKKNFSVQDVNLSDEDPDFAMVELWFLADGNNAQNSPISTEVLKRDASSFLGKPIVAKYDRWTEDVTSHVPDEVIVGWIPADSEIEFKEKDEKTFAVAHGIISKLYATDVYDLFKTHNYRSVSVEFSAEQPNMDSFGEGEITVLHGHGITILGLTTAPCVEGANIQVKKFSLEDANIYYDSYKNPLKKFSEERRKIMESKTIKVNKDELKTTPWGDVDKEALRDKVMNAKNKTSLIKDVYMLVEDGWEDAPSQHLKYPVMQIIGDTAYYNRGGLSSALGYAKAENEDTVVKKIESLYQKFKLDDEKDKDEGKEEEKKMAKDKPIDEKDKKDEEGKDQKDFADKPEVDKEDKTDEGKDKEGKPVDKKEDKEEKGKKFSLDAYADSGAMFAMLEKETEANKKMATDLFETGDANVIMSKVLDLQHKVDAFEAEKQMAEEKECSAEFAKCMGEVKGDIEEKEYAKLYEEGKDIKKKDDMSKFSAKVKAFAYENIKNKEPEKKDDDIFRFGAPFNNKNNDDKDVFTALLEGRN